MVGLGALTVVMFALAVGVYAARREAARQLLTGWLEERGVEAEVRFERLDPDGLIASITAGDPDDPDLAVERVEIDYALGLPWTGGFSLTPTRIRLVQPRVRAVLREGRISFGSLDPVIDSFTDRPPSDEGGGPLILIEDASARLITAGGDLTATGDARLERGRLMSLDAALGEARLRDEALSLDLRSGFVAVRTIGDRLGLSVRGDVEAVEAAGLAAREGQVQLAVELPYPDTRLRRTDGPVTVRTGLEAEHLSWDGGEAREALASLTFRGRAVGWIDALTLDGRLTGEASGETLTAGDAVLERVSAALGGERFHLTRGEDDLDWRYEGDVRLGAGAARQGNLSGRGVVLTLADAVMGGGDGGSEARGRLGVSADALAQDDLTLTGVTGGFDLDATAQGAVLATLTGGARSRGGSWSVLGPVGAADVPEQATLKRAFQSFALDAPGLAIRAGSPGVQVHLTRPARISPAGGGQILISAAPGQALYSAEPGRNGGGSLRLASEGGGLPRTLVEVARYDMGGGITARLSGRAGLDFGLARGVELTAAGRLDIRGGTTTFTATGCSPFSAAMLELGDNDVTDVSASLCPTSGPLVVISNGWRFQAEARALSANAPFLEMAVSDASGLVSASDTGSGLAIEAQVRDGAVSDTADPARFLPVRASGRVGLARDVWSGVFAVRDSVHGGRLADLTIHHSGASASGGLEIDARGVTFAAGGLQPDDLSPLAARIAHADAVGEVDFTGGFQWTPDGLTSRGLFQTGGLDFVSPAGRVTRLSGQVEFISLTPLLTAPEQRIRVERIEAFLPLASAEVEFELNADRLRVADGSVEVAGGTVTLEAMDIPLDPEASYEGVLVLDRVQLGEVLAGSGLGESVALDAVVSGRLPFVAGPNGITIIEGQIAAVQPGRLSISSEALAGVQADGGGEEVPPNAVQDFAYQALENLAFDQLGATINSLPGGRLGVLFTIHGRHDPPVEQEIRLTLRDLIERQFFNRELPLPSGTEINLTLDSSFNLDQLIADLMEIQRARTAGARSDTVQPQGR